MMLGLMLDVVLPFPFCGKAVPGENAEIISLGLHDLAP